MFRANRAIFLLLFLLLLPPALAQEGGTGTVIPAREEETTVERRMTLQRVILPALQGIIDSFSAQNTPVPEELKKLLERGKKLSTQADIAEFESLAERYFGKSWEGRVIDDASSMASPEAILHIRTRIYLTSLTSHAEQIAEKSPLSAEEIRSIAQDLLKESEITTQDFWSAFKEAYRGIFSADDENDLTSFQEEMSALLSDMNDGLALLVEGYRLQTFREDLEKLQSHLTLVTGQQELLAWLSRFEAFSKEVQRIVIPADRPLLLQDISALLHNLELYEQQLSSVEIDTEELRETVEDMRSKMQMIQTDEEFDRLLSELEDLLTNVSQKFQNPSTDKL